MSDIYFIMGIVMLVFGILQIILFYKLWGMTTDVSQIKNFFFNHLIRYTSIQTNAQISEQASAEQKVVGKWPVGTLVVHTSTWKQMRIKEITPDHKYVCTQGNLVMGPYAEDCLTSYEDYVANTLNKNTPSAGRIIFAVIVIVILAIALFS
jgi:hypothetical protein